MSYNPDETCLSSGEQLFYSHHWYPQDCCWGLPCLILPEVQVSISAICKNDLKCADLWTAMVQSPQDALVDNFDIHKCRWCKNIEHGQLRHFWVEAKVVWNKQITVSLFIAIVCYHCLLDGHGINHCHGHDGRTPAMAPAAALPSQRRRKDSQSSNSCSSSARSVSILGGPTAQDTPRDVLKDTCVGHMSLTVFLYIHT